MDVVVGFGGICHPVTVVNFRIDFSMFYLVAALELFSQGSNILMTIVSLVTCNHSCAI